MTRLDIARAAERVLLSLWIGGLWTTGLVAAPVLFHSYERMLAGDIAGRLFAAVSWLGLVCGSLLLLLAGWRAGRRPWRDWRVLVLAVMLLITLIGEFGLAARMRELKVLMLLETATPAFTAEFGRLHALAGALFVVNSTLGLILLVFGIRPRSAR